MLKCDQCPRRQSVLSACMIIISRTPAHFTVAEPWVHILHRFASYSRRVLWLGPKAGISLTCGAFCIVREVLKADSSW
jgi:hypothetical protein